MSLQLMVRVMQEIEVTRPQQTVLLAMAEHANDDGTSCYPSVDRIAWKTGYKPRAVEDIMRALRQEEIIVEVAPATAHRPTEYRIDLSQASEKMPFEEWREKHGKHKKKRSSGARGAKTAPVQNDAAGVQSHGRGVQFDEKSTRETAPEPSVKNPEIEPSVLSTEKDSLQSSFSVRGIANSEEQAGGQEGEALPAKAMTTLTVERCTEVGFDPAPHQKINWGSGWSKYLYVNSSAGTDPPDPEEAYAVLSEIVAAAAGQRGKGRYWLSVQDAIKRVRDDGTALGGKDRDKERRRRGGSAIWLTQEDLEKPDLYAGRI